MSDIENQEAEYIEFTLPSTIKVFCSKGGERTFYELRTSDWTGAFVETLLSEGISRIANDSHSGEKDVDKANEIFAEKIAEFADMTIRFGAGGGGARLSAETVALRAFIDTVARGRKILPKNIPDLARAGWSTLQDWAERDGTKAGKTGADLEAFVFAKLAKAKAHIDAQVALASDEF